MVNIQDNENFQNRILGCLYVDAKRMKELEDKIAVGNREAENEYDNIIMTSSCASIMQMWYWF